MTNSFYPPYHVGGACTQSKYLAEALVKEGHEVHVLASLDSYRMKYKFTKKTEEHNGVKVHWLESPRGKFEPILNYTFGTQKYTYDYFKRLVKTEKFDVVHHHNISLLGYKILKKIGNYKNIYTAHDYWLICPKYDYFRFGKICTVKSPANCVACCTLHKKPYQLFRHSAAFKKSINDIDTIIAPSQFMKNELKKGGIQNKIIQLYNFVPEPPKKLLKVPYTDYFLFVGQLEHHKGLVQLIDTFKELPDKNLIIIGKGSMLKYVETAAKENKNILYLGFKSRIETLSLMHYANALILPSIWGENNPMTVIEAMSVGTPTIGSDKGGIPELVSLIDKRLIFHNKQELANCLNKDLSEVKVKNLFFDGYYKKYLKIITE